METVFTPEAMSTIAIADSQLAFPVRRIYCVGQNYAEHVREMGGDPASTRPVFFTKPANAIVCENRAIDYPLATENLHFEVELVVALSAGGSNMSPEEAQDCVFGYAVGVDFTRRDLQKQCKAKGQPWDIAKGFDNSAPISQINMKSNCANVENSRIWLSVNDDMKQDGNTSDLIWDVAGIIVQLSNYFELKAGDLIFTGTPQGVGAVVAGDSIRAGVEGVGELSVTLKARETD